MSTTSDYQQGFYDGVSAVRKILDDDEGDSQNHAQDNFTNALRIYRRLLNKAIDRLLSPPAAI